MLILEYLREFLSCKMKPEVGIIFEEHHRDTICFWTTWDGCRIAPSNGVLFDNLSASGGSQRSFVTSNQQRYRGTGSPREPVKVLRIEVMQIHAVHPVSSEDDREWLGEPGEPVQLACHFYE